MEINEWYAKIDSCKEWEAVPKSDITINSTAIKIKNIQAPKLTKVFFVINGKKKRVVFKRVGFFRKLWHRIQLIICRRT